MLLLLLGCQDQNLSKLSDAEIGILPIIEVSPPVLAFGEYTDQPIVRNLTLSNVGEATLDISSIMIQGDEAISFTNQSGLTQLSLEPSEDATLPLIFEPTTIQNEATVSIGSNDINTPVVEVPLIGTLTAPMLSVTPNPIDMGGQTGCYSEHAFQVSNVGTAPLTIFAVSTQANDMDFISNTSLPLTLDPSESEELRIEFTPSTTDPVEDLFDIQSDAVNHPYSFSAMGYGLATEHSESWTIQEGPKSDILFSVDLSSSMSDDRHPRTASNTITTLLITLDWQVMVVNADHGCNHSGILTPSTPYDPAQAVQTGP